MRAYPSFPGLDKVYLEDSFVLGVQASEQSLVFELEVAIVEGHPAYQPPARGEQHCYVRGRLIFQQVRHSQWTRKTMRPVTDPDGSVDFGNLDELVEVRPGVFRVSGDFGEVLLQSSVPALQLDTGRDRRSDYLVSD